MARCGGQVSYIRVSDYHMTESTCYAVNSKKVAVYVLEVQARTRLLHPAVFFTNTHHFQECPTFRCKMRYRDLNHMNTDLAARHPDISLPSFPPKKWFGNKSEKFLHKRMQKLDEYFRELLTLSPVTRGESVLLALQPVAVWDLVVMGLPKIGKAQFVKRFLHYHPMSSNIPDQYLPLVSRIHNIEASSAVFPDIHSFNEIEKFTPVDLVIDNWLVRVNSIQVQSVELMDIKAVSSLVKSKDGVLILYRDEELQSERVAETLEVTYRAWKPVEKVRVWETHGGAFEHLVAAEYAYSAMTQFLRKLLHQAD